MWHLRKAIRTATGAAALVAALGLGGCAYQQHLSSGEDLRARGDYAAAIEQFGMAADSRNYLGRNDGWNRQHAAEMAWADTLTSEAQRLERTGHAGAAWLLATKAAQLDTRNAQAGADATRLRAEMAQRARYIVRAEPADARAREAIVEAARQLDPGASLRVALGPGLPAQAILRLSLSEPEVTTAMGDAIRTERRLIGTADGPRPERGRTFGFGGIGGAAVVGGASRGQLRAAAAAPATAGAPSGIDTRGTGQNNPPSRGNPLPATLGNPLPALGNPLPTLSNPAMLSPDTTALTPPPALSNISPPLAATTPALGNPLPGGLGNPADTRPRTTTVIASGPSVDTRGRAGQVARGGGGLRGGYEATLIESGDEGRRRIRPVYEERSYPVATRESSATARLTGSIEHADGRPEMKLDLPISANTVEDLALGGGVGAAAMPGGNATGEAPGGPTPGLARSNPGRAPDMMGRQASVGGEPRLRDAAGVDRGGGRPGNREAGSADRLTTRRPSAPGGAPIGVEGQAESRRMPAIADAMTSGSLESGLLLGTLTSRAAGVVRAALLRSFASWRAEQVGQAAGEPVALARIDHLAVYLASDPAHTSPEARRQFDAAARDFAQIPDATLLLTGR